MLQVLDASVFVKLFLDEPDRPKALSLVRSAISDSRSFLAPDLLTMECLSVALRYGVPFALVHNLVQSARGEYLEIIVPDVDDWLLAEKLALGDPVHGRPGLADSLYHALAIRRGAVMITADRSHFNKTKHHGCVMMLEDWQEN